MLTTWISIAIVLILNYVSQSTSTITLSIGSIHNNHNTIPSFIANQILLRWTECLLGMLRSRWTSPQENAKIYKLRGLIYVHRLRTPKVTCQMSGHTVKKHEHFGGVDLAESAAI